MSRYLLKSLSIVIFSSLSLIGLAGINGPTTGIVDNTYTYSFSNGTYLGNPNWQPSGGSVMSRWQSGYTYYSSIKWTATGTRQLMFANYSQPLATLSVDVCSSGQAAGVSLSGTTSICVGNNYTYTATPTNGGTTPGYDWKVNGVSKQSGGSSSYTTNILGLNDVVSVTMTSSISCVSPISASASLTISSATQPTPVTANIPQSGQVCPDQTQQPTYTVSVTNGGSNPTYTWYRNSLIATDNEITGNTNSYKPHYTLQTGQTIKCQVTSNATCISGSASVTSNIVTISVTNVSASSDFQICAGGTIQLYAWGGSTYYWTGPNGFYSYDTNPSIPNATTSGTYTVSANGCSRTASTTVTVNPLPTASINGNASVCQYAASPSITITGASSTPPYTFTYKINNGSDQVRTTTSGNSVTVAAPTDVVGPFTYTLVSVRDASLTTCSHAQTGTATVTVNPLDSDPSGINLSPNNNVCPGTSLTLSVVGGSLRPGAVWKWYSGSGSCGSTPEGAGTNIGVNPLVTTTYYVRAEGGCRITSCASLTVVVKELPSITVQPVNSSVVQNQDAYFPIIATGPNLQYQWQTSPTGEGSWTNLTGLPAIGYQTANLTIKGSATIEDNFYRCQITSDCSTIYSNNVKIVLVFPGSGYLYGNDIPDPETRQLSTSNLVGATSGSFNINPMGGSSYTIPLETPPGVNGLAPSLSLIYSSNSGSGIAGYGWQIGGLSSINRGPQTVYHDGKTKGIYLDIWDRFYLDGQRLVNTSSTYGDASAQYQTENDIFTRVTPQGIEDIYSTYGPAWFKAETKSGLVYEYGNSSESKQKISGHTNVLNWHVSKIYDLFGNQINFSYIKDHYSIYPAEIIYGQNTITFYYKSRTDKNSSYLLGSKTEQWLLLDKITVKYNSIVVKTYEFKQSYQGSYYNSYSILDEVIEYGIGSSRLNSTAISYQIPSNVAFSQTTYDTVHQYVNYNSLLRTGDFNRDGKADFLCLPTDGSWTGIKVFFGDGNDNFATSFSSTISIDLTRLRDIRVIDLNADGIDDIVYEYGTTPSSTTSTFYYMLCNGNSLTQPVSIGASQTYSVNAGLTGKTRRTIDRQEDDNEHTANRRDRPSTFSSLSSSKYKNSIDADYNGDGVNEIFMNDLSGNWQIYSLVNSSGQMTSVMNLLASETISTLTGEVLSGDFNGDGKADIWSFEDTGVNIYTFTGTTLNLLYSSTWPTNKHFFNLGDFNGDGKVDIFLYGYGKGGTEYDWAEWQIQLSTGTGFEEHSMTQKKSNLKNDNVRFGDFNGDGASDIMVTSKDHSWIGTYFYITKNNGTDFYTHSLPYYPDASHNYYLGDYNGDGHTDFICTDGVSPWWTGYQVYKTTGNTSILMEKIANGLGLLTKLTYNKLSEAASLVYQRGTGASFPVIDFQGPLSVVNSVLVDNGKGTMNTQNYYYEGAKIHIQGKGFLGYVKTRATDVTASIESESISGYNATYFYPQLLKTLSKRTGTTDTIEKATNLWSQKILDAPTKRIFAYLQGSTQTNILTGHSVTTNAQYDNFGNPTSITKSYLNGPTETTTNTYNNTVSSSQWLLGRPDSTRIQYSGNDTIITRSGTMLYDPNNNHLTSESWYPGTNNQITNSYLYNSNGTLQSETATANGMSRSKSCTYESDNIRIHTSTDQLSHVTTNSYDNYGRLFTQEDFLGNTTTYLYDNLNRKYSVSSTDGNQISTGYAWEDPTADPVYAQYSVLKTSNDGSQTKSWYDKLGREIQSGMKGFDGTMIYTSTVYNTKGQIENISDPYYSTGTALWNTFIYDNYGRKTNQSRPSGRNSTWQYTNNTTTETTAGKSFSKTFSSDGTMASATDAGGTITYTYYPDGKVKTITAPGGITTSMQYDPAGNQSQLVDPSAGTITYTYNGFGELTDQQNARTQTTHLSYYDDGRPDQKILSVEGTTTYNYNGNKQLTSINSPGDVSRTFGYDTKGRKITTTETIPGSSSFTTSVTYDDKGRNRTITHPSGITETKNYNSNGYLYSISVDDIVKWTTNGMNARQQVTSGQYGNNLSATFGYDNYGYPTSTVVDTIQNYTYNFDPVTSNLSWRQNNKHTGLREDFHYDNLDRLDSVYMGSTMTLDMAYESNKGGITTKSDVGTLLYNTSGKPYAVSSIDPPTGLTPDSSQTLTYTSFESVSTISENDYNASFTYNSDNERAQMVVQQGASTILTRWYPSNSYIKETEGSATKEYTFIGGNAYTAPVVAITQNETITYYDILRDYLGNITHIVNSETNAVVAEYSFDAWGRMRDPATWVNYNPGSEPVLFIAGRGFTGHEHLPWFNLINMNGRLYDPLTAMFLSPDNYVQSPDKTQNFNRYGYCLNNPLKYTDPSGYTWLSHFGGWMGDNWHAVATVAAFVAVAIIAFPVAVYWAGSYAINLVGNNMINNHMSLKEAFRRTPLVIGFNWTIPYNTSTPASSSLTDKQAYDLAEEMTKEDGLQVPAIDWSTATAGPGGAANSRGGFSVDFQGNGKLTIGVQAGGNVGGLGGTYGIFGNLGSVTLLGYENNKIVYPTSQQGGFTQINQGLSGGLIVGAGVSHTFDGSFEGRGYVNDSYSYQGVISDKKGIFGISYSSTPQGKTLNIGFNLQISLILGFEGSYYMRIKW